jgi:hypothetical protein
MHKGQCRLLVITAMLTAFMAVICAGGMRGAIFQASLTPAVAAFTAPATNQCESLPAAAMPAASPEGSASASPTAAAGSDLCVSVQANQAGIRAGETASWAIRVWTSDGTAAADVTITLTAMPAGLTARFASSCPSGSGAATCTVGDIATATTPASYLLQAQIQVPAVTTAGTATLTAIASTTPAMSLMPAAGQAITITRAIITRPPTPAATSASPAAATRVNRPVTTTATEPALSPLPVITPVMPAAATSAQPGTIASVLPEITPDASAGSFLSSPAANIEAIPDTSSPAAADNFSLTLGMSAQAAEILGGIILGLVITLAATRLIAAQLTPNKQLPAKHNRTRHTRKLWPAGSSVKRRTAPSTGHNASPDPSASTGQLGPAHRPAALPAPGGTFDQNERW